ncbi:hypothetical protein OGAPHI_000348 [Ogataea philodendri]|uniref:Uncharacterized protein n=1 Tax=Ogataea philodendri TaxID=1378263 RepID=A0A9P8T9S2_9ASCO|nr:uncharacterized protein OGAPHI_000348 [Ogataea philodendri]KAH3671643.1 hypothetical protein OGAPHI_000348 [Ogataea philodendri]
MRGRTERRPLGAKDANTHGVSRSTSPYKDSSSKSRSGSFSPVRIERPKSTKLDSNESLGMGLGKLSPSKRSSLGTVSPTKKLKPSKGFQIYEDRTNYRDTLEGLEAMAVTNIQNKENEPFVSSSPGKENLSPARRSAKRAALSDLRIDEYPGYIQVAEPRTNGVLAPKHQLKQSFMFRPSSSTKRAAIPSFITPPKKNRIQYKYIGSLNSQQPDPEVRSRTDLDTGVVRKLTFDIQSDSIASYETRKK